MLTCLCSDSARVERWRQWCESRSIQALLSHVDRIELCLGMRARLKASVLKCCVLFYGRAVLHRFNLIRFKLH